eukprot:XP_008646803.1 protein qua-1-like [Zea mays]
MVSSKKGKKGRHHADGKWKHPPGPPSKDYRDSEYSEEVSSEYDRSPTPASPVASSEDSDDSMGLSIAARGDPSSTRGLGSGDEGNGVEGNSSSDDDSGKGSGDNISEGSGDGDGDRSDGSGDDCDGKGDGQGDGDDEGGSNGGDGKAGGIMLST